MRIKDLADALDVPPTRVAETAWPTAERRARRRRLAVALSGAATAAALAIAATTVADGSTRGDLSPATTSPSRSTSRLTVTSTKSITPGITMPALIGDSPNSPALTELLQDGVRGPLPHRTVLGTATQGVHTAGESPVLARSSGDVDIEVLYAGGAIERLDVPGLRRLRRDYQVHPLRTTSMSPDDTRLALPQPGGLAVVNLQTSEVQHFDVGGPGNLDVAWTDASHVLVSESDQYAVEAATTGSVVDLTTGQVRAAPYVATTSFDDDGEPVTWASGERALRFGDRLKVVTTLVNDSSAFPHAPLIGDGFIVGISSNGSSEGPVVIDTTTGDPVAYLPTSPRAYVNDTQLLAVEGHTVQLGLPVTGGTLLVSWDWKQRTIRADIFVAGDGPQAPVVAFRQSTGMSPDPVGAS